MRPFDYARTLPQARQGFAVFAVRFAFVIMARHSYGQFGSASMAFRLRPSQGNSRIGINEVESAIAVTQ
jgi:hypothetical protein